MGIKGAKGEVTAALLVIGDEVLSGRTRDANVQYLARWLGDLGVRLVEVRIIPDRPEVIAAQVADVRARCDYLFTTGGIGPTHDDRTTAAVAAAFELPLIQVKVVARESDIAHHLEALVAELSSTYPDLEIGCYPFHVGVRPAAALVSRSTDPSAVRQASARLRELMAGLGVAPVP